jgi:hypothetical protein
MRQPNGAAQTGACDHDYAYFEDPEQSYAGHLERCRKCKHIVQVIQ